MATDDFQENRAQWLALTHKVMSAIDEAVRGSEFAPPSDEPSVMTECVVIMGWNDGNGGYVQTHLRIGSSWGTEGLVVRALREIEAADEDGGPQDDNGAL
jgi:hypothetical protein